MSSLQYSCTVLSTNPKHRTPLARRRRHFQVSCNDKKTPPSSEARVDRRNMLLGLGGLYGAATLISDPKAYADPIEAPDLKACGRPRDFRTGNPLDANCCLPASNTVVDYELPSATPARIRPAAHVLNKADLAKYEKAVGIMKELPADDPRSFMMQANIHCAYCNGVYDQPGKGDLDIQVHNSWLFFPFHRWYLYFYERILGSLIGDPTFALPYWNWDHPRGMSLPLIFDDENSSLYDKNRNPDHRLKGHEFEPPVVKLNVKSSITDRLELVRDNLSVMYNEMVSSCTRPTDFLGQPYVKGDKPPGIGSAGKSERGSHTGVHLWVGDPDNPYREDLGNFYSAGRDPAFYCHHANVDRMWAIWRTLNSPPTVKDITDPDFLNASFLFYDEKKNLVRVKAGDCVDHTKLGYEFEEAELLWKDLAPPKKERVDLNKLLELKGVEDPKKIFPLKLESVTRVLVPKSVTGKADEELVLEGIETDPTELVKMDVYINDEDDEPEGVYKATYVGTFAQVPHKSHAKKGKSSLRFCLKDVYDDIDVGDDDFVVVTLIPRFRNRTITIDGIKIVETKAA